MTDKNIEVGSVVYLKSGSPGLTVLAISGDRGGQYQDKDGERVRGLMPNHVRVTWEGPQGLAEFENFPTACVSLTKPVCPDSEATLARIRELREMVANIPKREVPISGQRHWYVQRGEVLDCFDEALGTL